MSPESFWYRVLDPVADAVNPILTLLVLLAPRLERRWPGWWPALRHWLRGSVVLAIVYAVRALDARFGIWAAIGADYSTHTAYAVALALCLACWSRRWRWPMAVVLLGYAGLILVVGYHSFRDVVTSAAVAGLTAGAVCFVLGDRSRRNRGRLTQDPAN